VKKKETAEKKMPVRVRNTSLEGADQDCVLNTQTHQCVWRIGARQCKLKNAKFGLNMDVYGAKVQFGRMRDGTWRHPNQMSYDRVQAAIADGHLNAANRTGRQYFCWHHAMKLTGLRVVRHAAMDNDLVAKAAFRKGELVATFAQEQVPWVRGMPRGASVHERMNYLYGEDNVAPYGLNETHDHVETDDLCTRDMADYANDVRIDITDARNPRACHRDGGMRREDCWALKGMERPLVNVELVEETVDDEPCLILAATKNIAIDDRILWDYGKKYWSGTFCEEDDGEWALCNAVKQTTR
jgi:hypothetical protein